MGRKADCTFTESKTLITYDLSPCKITVDEICAQNSNLENYISIKNKGAFELPNTTILTKLTKDTAIEAFKKAVSNASNDKEKITRLFAAEIYQKEGTVENN